jgi:hypothetical protein
LFERRQPGVLVKAVSAERTISPGPDLELTPVHCLLNIDTYFGDPLEMFFPQVGVNEMKGFIPSVETIFDKRAKHSVLLVGVIEESTNMMLAGDITAGKPHGLTSDYHMSPTSKTHDLRIGIVERIASCDQP